MHEYGIAEVLVSAIEDELKKNDGKRALTAWVEVGAISGINPEALASVYPIASKGTSVENTQLRILVEPAHCKCNNCNYEFLVEEYTDIFLCENCGGSSVNYPEKAQKIFLLKLEIEKDQRPLLIDLKDNEIEEEHTNEKNANPH